MFKSFSLILLLTVALDAVIVKSTPLEKDVKSFEVLSSSPWLPHLLDFLDLVDIDMVMEVAMKYLYDPEVIQFMAFVFSPNFKEIIWEFESMAEFKEASAYLAAKGYDNIYEILNLLNAALNLPPYEFTKMMKSKNGISGLFEDLIEVLPLEDIKKLFEEKLHNNEDVADLFEIVNSEEFLDILKRMSRNPTFIEMKMTFQNYGFDFKLLCNLAKEIFADYYQGVFCY